MAADEDCLRMVDLGKHQISSRGSPLDLAEKWFIWELGNLTWINVIFMFLTMLNNFLTRAAATDAQISSAWCDLFGTHDRDDRFCTRGRCGQWPSVGAPLV
jgi:hypothetical protein